jgi:hypothetical protein
MSALKTKLPRSVFEGHVVEPALDPSGRNSLKAVYDASARCRLCPKTPTSNWCVPFGTQRVEAEGMINRVNKDIEMNPKAEDSHPSTNEA